LPDDNGVVGDGYGTSGLLPFNVRLLWSWTSNWGRTYRCATPYAEPSILRVVSIAFWAFQGKCTPSVLTPPPRI